MLVVIVVPLHVILVVIPLDHFPLRIFASSPLVPFLCVLATCLSLVYDRLILLPTHHARHKKEGKTS